MDRTLRVLGIVAIVGLLAAILAFLVVLSRNGIHIDYKGDVQIIGMPKEVALRFAGPVTLTLADGATLTAAVSGIQTAPVALAFAGATCPTCGSAMLPVRYDVLTGRIEWACPNCGKTAP